VAMVRPGCKCPTGANDGEQRRKISQISLLPPFKAFMASASHAAASVSPLS
jgi:hypothetical protein